MTIKDGAEETRPDRNKTKALNKQDMQE